MCVVSMVGDFYKDKWMPPQSTGTVIQQFLDNPNHATKEELAELKKEVLEMKELLKRALEYDKRNNEPHCETDDKVSLLKKVAELVGVDLKEIFPNP